MTVAHSAAQAHGDHLVHVVVALALLASLAVGYDLVQRRRQRTALPGSREGSTAVPGSRESSTAVRCAAALSLVAGVVHAAVCPPHAAESLLYGAFFAAAALIQLAWAAALLRWPRPEVVVGGALVNAGLVAVWLVSRTVGVPVGPEAGSVEAVGPADLVAVAAELALLVVLVRLLRPSRSRSARLQPVPR